jgi:hypothetical protein
VNDRFPKALTALGLLIGTIAALFYARQGLTLSHYDAKAHLVVARRILDSLTPEYSQIGAVWLPLPHLLNLLPVQIDTFYRTGASGVALSVLAFGLACYAIARIVLRVTGSRAGAALGVAMFALDPDVLYLQSTPMTEPLLFGLALLAVSLVYDWVEDGARTSPRAAGWALVAACLTRYEAWFVAAAAIVLAAIALWRHGLAVPSVLKATTKLAMYPAAAVVGFILHSRFTIGEWFVTGGFFVSDNAAHGHPYDAFMQVVYGVRVLAGTPVVVAAVAGILAVLVGGLIRRERTSSLVVLALAAFMVLPSYAFYQGHPFRMRYMVAPVVGATVFVGVAVGMLRGWWRHLGALVLAVWLVATARPLDAHAPMVQEAQWDRPFSIRRREVTACLMRDYRHEPILASMGSLAHYMQELSHEGIGIRDFVHEGNMPLWQEAIESPKGRVGWILVEERAEGGDVLAARARESSKFLTGFRRMCADGGVALYRAED